MCVLSRRHAPLQLSESPPFVEAPHAASRLLYELLRAHGITPGPDDIRKPLILRCSNCGNDRLIPSAVAFAGRYRQKVALWQCRVWQGICNGPTRSPRIVVPRYACAEERYRKGARIFEDADGEVAFIGSVLQRPRDARALRMQQASGVRRDRRAHQTFSKRRCGNYR
jgi:hypothetical protein